MISGRDKDGPYVQWGPAGRRYRYRAGDKRSQRIACNRCRMAALGRSANHGVRDTGYGSTAENRRG